MISNSHPTDWAVNKRTMNGLETWFGVKRAGYSFLLTCMVVPGLRAFRRSTPDTKAGRSLQV